MAEETLTESLLTDKTNSEEAVDFLAVLFADCQRVRLQYTHRLRFGSVGVQTSGRQEPPRFGSDVRETLSTSSIAARKHSVKHSRLESWAELCLKCSASTKRHGTIRGIGFAGSADPVDKMADGGTSIMPQ